MNESSDLQQISSDNLANKLEHIYIYTPLEFSFSFFYGSHWRCYKAQISQIIYFAFIKTENKSLYSLIVIIITVKESKTPPPKKKKKKKKKLVITHKKVIHRYT